MNVARAGPGLVFCIFFVVSYFTNKYVLSVLKFTYPTLFLGGQTCTGTLLLLVAGKLGWVEVNGLTRSAAVFWLPGSVLFLGNIYAGSKALSMLPIPFFFVLQNVSEVVFTFIIRVTQREIIMDEAIQSSFDVGVSFNHNTAQSSVWTKWLWLGHCPPFMYRVIQSVSEEFKVQPSEVLLKDFAQPTIQFGITFIQIDLEQQLINYMVSMLLLVSAAHPTGDFFGALEFPFLMSYEFHSGCFASAILGFLLLLASVKLKSGLSTIHCAVWFFLAKVLASVLSIFIFSTDLSLSTLSCILTNYAGEALSIYSDRV